MSNIIEIVVAGEPVAKGRPRVTTAGGFARTYSPAKTRNYENLIRMAAGEAMRGADPLVGPVQMEMHAYLPIPTSWSGKRQRLAEEGEILPAKRPDLDNFTKAALDGCNGIVFKDDALVCDLHAVKVYSRRPRLVIRIWPIDVPP